MQRRLPPPPTALPRGRAALTAALLMLAGAVAAQVTITGTVTDAEGETLIGANVTVTGAPGVGTITDIDGTYSLEVPAATESLTFSYVGYGERAVEIAGRTTLDVVLRSDQNLLEEVVVVGYGMVARRDLPGSVDQISEKQIENIPVTSFEQTLAGQIQGVQFRQGSGQPGAGAEILIRGIGSFTGDGNAPLIVIDGVPFGNYNAQTNNFLNLVNPNDIATITVVRDPAEKAIYGSRASAGLILITTKSGRSTAPRISFNSYVGLQVIPEFEKPDVLNATELAELLAARETDIDLAAGREVDIPENLRDPSQYGEGTDWFDLITQSAPMYNADLSVRGGSDNFRYSISAGYTNQEGVIKTSMFERYTARVNLDADVTDWLNVSMNLAPSWTETRNSDTDAGSGQFSAYNVALTARWADPTGRAYDDDGNLTISTRGELLPFFQANPLYRLENEYTLRTNRQLITNLKARADLGGGFSLSGSLAGNLRFNNIAGFSGSQVFGGSLTPTNLQPRASASSARAEQQRLVFETQLGFARELGADQRHSVDAFVGYATEIQKDIGFSANGNTLIDENFRIFNSSNIQPFNPFNLEAGTQINFSAGESVTEQALISYLGRARYDFDNRYFATLAIRSDGSSRFGENNRFALFPSASVGWEVSAEPWFGDLLGSAVSQLRLSASAGLTGSNTVADYRYQGRVGASGYVLGGASVRGLGLNAIPNQDLSWEENEQLDLSAKVGFADDRFVFTGTYYQQTTTGLLFDAPIPPISGFGTRFQNLGSIRNRGVEFLAVTQPVRRDKLIWNVSANVSANRGTVLALGPGDDPTLRTTRAGTGTPISWTVVGDEIGQYYGLQMIGLISPEQLADPEFARYPGARVGSPYFVDGDGDGVLERDVGDFSDFVKIGNPWPDFTFGLNTDVTYGSWGLRVSSLGEVGSEIFDLYNEIIYNTEGVFNVDRAVQNPYRFGSEDYSLRPPIMLGNASNTYRTRSSTQVFDGTYWRINNVTLSYTLTPTSEKLAWLSSAQVYFAVQNALTFSSYRGNPQIKRVTNSGTIERNVNYGYYPSARTYQVGTSITL